MYLPRTQVFNVGGRPGTHSLRTPIIKIEHVKQCWGNDNW